MKKISILSGFILISFFTGILNVQAATYDASEISKLKKFLMQESAEAGVKNYEQLGITDINNVDWSAVRGLSWNNDTYLLEKVQWSDKKLSGTMDFVGFQALKQLYCAFNNLQSIKVMNAPSLTVLDIYKNDIYAIDITTNTKLNYIRMGYNNIGEIDASNNPSLSFFCCTNNRIDSLDLSGKTHLETLYCLGNDMTILKIENCTSLTKLQCGLNKLTSLNLYNLPSLVTFSCTLNDLSELNFYNCGSLEDVSCSKNELTKLDFSSCKNLTSLNCYENNLDTLNLGGCNKLRSLRCADNNLGTLDVSDKPQLSVLSCEDNNLDFLTLPAVSEQFISYKYVHQNYVALQCQYDSIDFRDAYDIGGNITEYGFYHKNTTTEPLQSNNGFFSFDESYIGETVICRMRSNSFPGLVMRYDITLKERDDDVSTLKPEFESAHIYGSKGNLHINAFVPSDICIYSLQGEMLMKTAVGEGYTVMPFGSGIYVITVNREKAYKVAVR